MDNPLSQTRMEYTKDRIQHYSKEARECLDCGQIYYPKVHSQPYIVQFGAIIVGIAIFSVFKLGAPAWLYAALPLPLLLFMIYYYLKDRKAVSSKMVKPKYGQVIVECPECGGDKPIASGNTDKPLA